MGVLVVRGEVDETAVISSNATLVRFTGRGGGGESSTELNLPEARLNPGN